VNGIDQDPLEGNSLVYSFDNATAKETHTVQYFEMFGNRAMYADGWFARTIHKAPWEAKPRAALTEDTWDLYDTRTDFSLANNLAASNPAKLKELQDLFMKEAVAHNVLPIDDRVIERANAKIAGRPDVMGDRTSLTLGEGMRGMSENVFMNIKNRSVTITADVDIPPGGANGVILAQGGRVGGFSLYFKNGKPMYHYNYLGMQRFTVASAQAVPAGKATIRFEFAYDGGGLGKGGLGTIYVNDKKVADGRIERTQPMIFSADETADVGQDDAMPVTEDYKRADNAFTGKIHSVKIDIGPMGAATKAEVTKATVESAKKLENAK
jgi:arylsulfatase